MLHYINQASNSNRGCVISISDTDLKDLWLTPKTLSRVPLTISVLTLNFFNGRLNVSWFVHTDNGEGGKLNIRVPSRFYKVTGHFV